MSLRGKILKDIENAMKDRDMPRIKVLRFLNSAVKNKEIDLRPDPLTEDHIFGVLKKQIKQINESLEHYKKAGYTEQVGKEKFLLSVLESYLPKALTEEELTKIVGQVIVELEARSLKDMGSVMKASMAKAKGSANGKLLSQIVRGELSKL